MDLDEAWQREYSWGRHSHIHNAPRFVRASATSADSTVSAAPTQSEKKKQPDASSFYRSLVDSNFREPSEPPGPSPVQAREKESGPVASTSAAVDPQSPPETDASASWCDLCQASYRGAFASHKSSLSHILKRDLPKPVTLPTHYAIPANSIGYQSLLRSGWTDAERGLGLHEQGTKQPLKSSEKRDKLGIGLKRVDRHNIREKSKLLGWKETVRKADKDKKETERLRREVSGSDAEWNKMYQ